MLVFLITLFGLLFHEIEATLFHRIIQFDFETLNFNVHIEITMNLRLLFNCRDFLLIRDEWGKWFLIWNKRIYNLFKLKDDLSYISIEFDLAIFVLFYCPRLLAKALIVGLILIKVTWLKEVVIRDIFRISNFEFILLTWHLFICGIFWRLWILDEHHFGVLVQNYIFGWAIVAFIVFIYLEFDQHIFCNEEELLVI